MQKKYDIIVIGAGNSGLSAAVRSAISGKKTLLIEQHNVPGGCATSFVRGRFEFDPSLHEMCDYGTKENPGEVKSLMDDMGVDFDMLPVKDLFRVISKFSDGTPMDVTMPCGKDAFFDAMEKYVPGSRPYMDTLWALILECREGIEYLSNGETEYKASVLIKKYMNMLKAGTYSVNQVFEALNIPQKCRDIFSAYWSYLGVNMDQIAFTHYSLMVEKYINKGASIPRHTSHQLSTRLLERFRQAGGECLFTCRAEEILFDGEKACGVRTTKGNFYGDYILSNINPEITLGKLVPKDKVPDFEKRLVSARNGNFCGRMFTVYLGLDCSYEDLGITDYSIFFMNSADSVKEYNSIKDKEKNEFNIFLCYNVSNPDVSPKGTCICSFTSFHDPSFWDNLNPIEYAHKKTYYAEKLIDNLKRKTGISLKEHIEEIEIASPLTFARYINVPEGSVYGYELREWDNSISRMMMIENDNAIPHFYHIGTSSARGVGYNGTYIIGDLVARKVIKKMNNMEELK
ncbi:MAG: NAD(P)/FAD-dependent oxidoreductase [Treponema sp.]|nr:NAD(P)/FAD-dependent oxidoreductase [Treponema sp.]